MDREDFARRLRELRRRAGLSQEELASRLGVSAQAVSKWELAANLPETGVLVPLARLLGVSTDELLMSPVRREEWEEKWRSAWKGRDHFALLAIAEDALRELPEDREWRFRQGNEEYQTAALTEDPAERERLLRLSEGHLASLLRDHPGDEEAGTALVCTLLALDRRREAEALAERLPNREKLQLILQKGREREKALRQIITRSVFELLNLLLEDGSPEALGMAEAILASAGKDEQLIWYWMGLHRQRAVLLCEKGDRAAAIRELGALTDRVCENESFPPKETNFLAPALEAGSAEERRRWVAEALAEEAFASLRETPEFRALSARAGDSQGK